MAGITLDTENSDDGYSETDDEEFMQVQREKQNPLWSSAHTVLPAMQEGCAWYCVSFEQVINCH